MHNAWIDRFLANIPEEPDEGNCWNWQGYVDPNGYGRFARVQDRTAWNVEYAHRVSYRYFRGYLPDSLTIDHLRRNRRCVNPDHLEAVPIRVNILRGHSIPARNARKARCIRGHPLSGDNLGVNPDGSRRCLICQKAAHGRYYKAHRKRILEQHRDRYKAQKLREAEMLV